MKNLERRVFALATALVVALPLAACGGGSPTDPEADATDGPTARSGSADDSSGMPAAFWSPTPLEGAIDVVDAREGGRDGSQVVLRGTLQDFGELATFRLVEDSLEDCSESEDDQCPTPWDYCCVDPSTLGSLTVNVEFLDGEFPAEWSLRGEHGLDHLSEVTVAGTLRFDEAGNMRLEATRMGPG